MTLGHLGQFDEINCDSRTHKVLSNCILMLDFFVCHCVCSFQIHMFNSTPADISRFWSILGILEPFAFSVFLFCHPFAKNNERFTKRLCVALCLNLEHMRVLQLVCAHVCVLAILTYVSYNLCVCLCVCLHFWHVRVATCVFACVCAFNSHVCMLQFVCARVCVLVIFTSMCCNLCVCTCVCTCVCMKFSRVCVAICVCMCVCL